MIAININLMKYLWLLPCLANAFSHNKVMGYFQDYDLNHDGYLARTEYEQKLSEEDAQNGME